MVNTIKFSQFATVDANNPTNKLVGFDAPGGNNIQSPLTVSWTTLTRPTMPYDGLWGYNTTLEQYEYYQGSSMMWVQFTTNGNDVPWDVVTAASQDAAVNSGYVTNRSATPVQILLPATFAIGNRILVMGMGTGGWSIVANTGQSIVFGSTATSTDGSISSDIQYSNIEIRGFIPSTTWTVWSINSNPTIV